MSMVRNLYQQDENISKELLFQVEAAFLALDISYVLQITQVQAVRYIPEQPEFIKGIIIVQNQVVPIMDLRIKLGFGEKPYDNRTCFVIIKIKNEYLGIIVDRVMNIIDVNQEKIIYENSEKNKFGKIGRGYIEINNEKIHLIDPASLL